LTALAGANLGQPVLDLLVQPVPDVYVLELSSFQLAISGDLPLHAACLLNISEDHLDWHRSYQAYARAKHAIYRHAKHRVAYHGEGGDCMPQDGQAVVFSEGEPDAGQAWGLRVIEGQLHVARGEIPLLAISDLAVWGQHQWLNVMAACALAETMAVSFDCMRGVLRGFRGLAHRCQRVRQWRGVHWYNDSKGTNPAATMTALRSVAAETKGKVVVLLGGLSKEADFTTLGALVSSLNAQVLVYGRDAKRIAAMMPAGVAHQVLPDLHTVVHCAERMANHGDAVLLSPACASWDQFDSYQQRGVAFVRMVESLL
jgi:UDP-N-acetylmuramoylalanine--D-glutamate ligase